MDEVFAHTTVSPAHACFACVSVLYFANVPVVGWPVEAPAPVLTALPEVGAWSVPGGGDIEGDVAGGAAVGVWASATATVVRKHIKAIAFARRIVLLLGQTAKK